MSNFLKNLHPLLRRKKNPKDNEDVNYALIKVLNEEMNLIEQDAIESKLQSSLKSSTGTYLDKFGDWFGVYRKKDEDDEKYRARIIKYLLLKRGTNNAIIEAIKDYLEDSNADVSIYEPFRNIFYTNKSHLNGQDHLMGYYYNFAIINVSIGSYFPVEVVDVINEFKPAGVKFYVTYDGGGTNTGNSVIKVLDEPVNIDVYQNIDRLSGYSETFYGHINMGLRKVSYDSETDIFKTNRSKINSNDVLTGSSSIGRAFHNYAYKTSYVYNPTKTSTVSEIKTVLDEKGRELPLEYYINTTEKGRQPVTIDVNSTTGTTFIYNNLNLREYFSQYKPELLQGDSQEVKNTIASYMGTSTLDLFMEALISPDETISTQTQVFDFSIGKWVTIKNSKITYGTQNVGAELGYVKDYMNNELNMFTRVSILSPNNVTVRVNYLDLLFYHYTPDVYTVKPYKGLIEYHIELDRLSYVDAFKVSSLSNGDIISKLGYEPIQYLRIVDEYDNIINRNLLRNTTQEYLENQGTLGYSSGIVTEDGKKAVIFNNSNDIIYLKGTDYSLVEGETYTFSFYAKATKPIGMTQGVYINGQNRGFIRDTIFTTDWARYSFTFVAIGNNNVGIHMYPKIKNNDGTYESFYVTDWKLEIGDSVTKVQPNPEDVYGATDPNNSVNIKAKDVYGNTIPNYEIPLNSYKPGDNMVKDSESRRAINGSSNSKRAVYKLYEKIEVGKEYTLTFSIKITSGDINNKTSIMLTNVIGDRIYVNLDKDNKGKYTFIADKVSDEISIFLGSAYTVDNENSDGRILRVNLVEGSKETIYRPNPNDLVKFVDKTIKFEGAHTNIQEISILNSIDLNKVKLLYSIHGLKYNTLKELTKITSGETHTDNEIKDLYGLQLIDYSELNAMSTVKLKSIWETTIGEITSSEGSFTDMPNNYFNATWQYVDRLNTVTIGAMDVLDDIAGGIIDNSNQTVTTRRKPIISQYTDLIDISTVNPVYTEDITMGSPRILEELKEVTMAEETIEIDRSIKVIDTHAEQEPNTSIIKGGFQTKQVAGSQYVSYELYEPVQEGQRYEIIVRGDFKDSLEFVSLYNSNPNFNETFLNPTDVVDGIATKEFIARKATADKPRPNTDVRLYIRPYTADPSTIYSVELRKL